MKSALKKRIGLVLSSIHTGAAVNMWSSFVETAENQTLFIFPGGILESEADFEYLRNPVYALANTRTLDGLVCWSSAICFPLSRERFDAFHAAFDPLPYLTITEKAAGRPCLTFDAYKGMKELVTHFITRHGAQRIAFLRGPEHHVSAQDRFEGYRDALKEAGLGYDGRLVTSPFGWEHGDEAAMQLVVNRDLVPGRDFDTLIGSSDMMTVPAIQYLHERGYAMPEDYRAGGFNNSAESEILPYPLSTVRMPYAELAGESLRVLQDLMNGAVDGSNANSGCNGNEGRTLPCEIVIRESCGCPGVNDRLPAITKYIRIQYEREKRRDVLNTLKTELLGLRGRQSLILSLARHLPQIGIFTAAVVVYLDGKRSECIGGFSPEGVVDGGMRFEAGLLFPAAIAGQYTDGAFMVQPLFTENRTIGHILTNVPFCDGLILEELRSCVSGALKGIFLMERLLQQSTPSDIGLLPVSAGALKENPQYLYIGFEDRWSPPWAGDTEPVYIYSHKDFAGAVARGAPALILIGSLNETAIETLETARRHPVTAMTPILVLPEKIEADDGFTALCRFPRVLLCNRGTAAFEVFGTRARAVTEGSAILPPRTGALVKKTILLFNNSPGSHMSRVKIARTVKTSEDYLTRIFHQEMGFSLWEYLNGYRVYIAAGLLANTGYSIHEVALRAGFPDQAYFTRVFKKIFKKSPSEIRKPPVRT